MLRVRPKRPKLDLRPMIWFAPRVGGVSSRALWPRSCQSFASGKLKKTKKARENSRKLEKARENSGKLGNAQETRENLIRDRVHRICTESLCSVTLHAASPCSALFAPRMDMHGFTLVYTYLKAHSADPPPCQRELQSQRAAFLFGAGLVLKLVFF